mmetsp:Transcript_81399/g.119231  ORF Transcript_81399/g.119231 Transcript_81399/m.119231 type:complete len:271 (-) Transcript_81399:377-1189(-)
MAVSSAMLHRIRPWTRRRVPWSSRRPMAVLLVVLADSMPLPVSACLSPGKSSQVSCRRFAVPRVTKRMRRARATKLRVVWPWRWQGPLAGFSAMPSALETAMTWMSPWRLRRMVQRRAPRHTMTTRSPCSRRCRASKRAKPSLAAPAWQPTWSWTIPTPHSTSHRSRRLQLLAPAAALARPRVVAWPRRRRPFAAAVAQIGGAACAVLVQWPWTPRTASTPSTSFSRKLASAFLQTSSSRIRASRPCALRWAPHAAATTRLLSTTNCCLS